MSILWINGLNNQNGICPVLKKKWKYFEVTTSIALNIDNFLCPPNNTGLQLPSLLWALTAPVFLPFIEPFPLVHKYRLSQKSDKSKTNSSHSLTPLQLLPPVPHSLLTRSPTGQAPGILHLGAHHTLLAASTWPGSGTLPQVKPYSFLPGSPAGAACPSPNPLMCVQMLSLSFPYKILLIILIKIKNMTWIWKTPTLSFLILIFLGKLQSYITGAPAPMPEEHLKLPKVPTRFVLCFQSFLTLATQNGNMGT